MLSSSQGGSCTQLTNGTVAVGAENQIGSGASVTGQFALVIPGYYSPDHPNGDVSSLSQYMVEVTPYDPHGSNLNNGPLTARGPDMQDAGPQGTPRFSLVALEG